MHHLYPSGKGDPLCPLGFHPQVRWPTRCKRCFRDYKEHGGRKKDDDPPLRRDDVTASSPSLSTWSTASSWTRDDVRSPSVGETNSGRNWSSNTNLENGIPGVILDKSKDINIRFGNKPASWTSTPDLANLNDDTQANVTTVNLTLPKRKPPPEDTGQETITLRKPPLIMIGKNDSLAARVKKLQEAKNKAKALNDTNEANRIKVKELKAAVKEPSNHDVQFLIQVKSKAQAMEKAQALEKAQSKEKEKQKISPEKYKQIDDVNGSSSEGPSSSSDSEAENDNVSIAGTETTDTTLVAQEDELQEQVDTLKQELETMKTRCERAEREKSDILLRRLATYETTTSKTTASEVLKLQQKVNELQSHSEDLQDEKKSLSLRVKELEEEIESRPTSSEAKRVQDELRAKLAAAETLCEELMDENEDMKKELRDLEEEIEEMQDNFREDQADEYTSLKKELEQTAKNCRILSFKLRKTERKVEQLETEKNEAENKLQEISGSKNAINNIERLKHLEQELKVSNEISNRLQKELEEANEKVSKIEEGKSTVPKKKAPMLGSIGKNPSGDGKVSRESLTRGGSQEDPVQLLRDLQDSIEREADLREQLRFAEEEGQNLRRKIARVEDDNESLVLQLKKMATKARSQKSPTSSRLLPETNVEKDEGISDEEDPADLRILLELNEQETAVLRKKCEDIEAENESLKKNMKDIKEKHEEKVIVKPTTTTTHTKLGPIATQKLKVLEEEISDLRKKLIEKDRDFERLHAELSLTQKQKTKGTLVKSKSLDGDQQALDLKRQLQVIEQEAMVLRTKTQSLEVENEKLLAENKKLNLLRGTKKTLNDKSTEVYVDKIATLEVELTEANNKLNEYKTKLESEKKSEVALIKKPGDDLEKKKAKEELDKIKLQLTKTETKRDKLSDTIKKLKDEAAHIKPRTPKRPTDLTTKLQMKRMVDELENEIGEVLVLLKNSEARRTKVEEELKTSNKLETSAKLEQLNHELSETKKKLAELEKEMINEKNKSNTEHHSLKQELSTSDDKLKELNKKLETLTKEKDALNLSLTSVQNEKDKIENDSKKQQANYDLKGKEIETLNKKLETLQKDIENKNKSVEKLQNDLEKAQKSENEKQKLIKDIGDKTKSISDLEKKLKDADDKIKRNDKLLTSNKETIARLEKQEALLKAESNNTTTEGMRLLQEEVLAITTKLKAAESQSEMADKKKETLEEKVKKLETDLKSEKSTAESKIKELETDLNAERMKIERIKINHEKEQKNRELELGALKTKIKSLEQNSGLGTKKIADLKKEYQDQIDKFSADLKKSIQDYDDLTSKYEMLEEEHVVTKAQLVTEKELITSQLHNTQQQLESIVMELQTLRDTYTAKQDAWMVEKLAMQEKMKELEEKMSRNNNETLALERNRYKSIIDDKTLEIEKQIKESEVLQDQLEIFKKENDELKKKLDDFDKVSKIQRTMTADSNALEKELRLLKSKVSNTEKVHKTEITQCKMRYDNQVGVLNEELQSSQVQVMRFKRERDNFKHMLEQAQKTIGDLKNRSLKKPGTENRNSNASYDEMEESRNKIATLEQQISCMEDELSESRLESSKLRTELVSERSSWEVKLSEMQSRVNELEEERILSSGRTKIPGLRTRMELAWQKEREEQQRLLQETSTLARDLRQTLFEVERERDKERLESKRKQDQLKKSVEEEQDENRKKINEIQCDLLELRDAHAKLRTTNEKLRREKERHEREREEMRAIVSSKRRAEQEEERRISSLLEQVEQLIILVPDLLPQDADKEVFNSLLAMTPTPPRRTKGKSRESSPLLERRSLSREPSPRREVKQVQLQSTLSRLHDATEELRRYQRLGESEREKERAKRFGMRRAASTETEHGESDIRIRGVVKRNGVSETGKLHRKSLSLEQTAAQMEQNIWKIEDDSLTSLQSLDAERFLHMKRDSSMDSRLSGGSTQSEIITSDSDKKKKKGFMGKLKKLTKSHSIDDTSDSRAGSSSLINQGYESDNSVDIKSSKTNLKGKIAGMFKRAGSSSRSNSVERKTKLESPDTSSLQRPLTKNGHSNIVSSSQSESAATIKKTKKK